MFPVPDDPHADLRQWLNGGVFCDASGTAYRHAIIGGGDNVAAVCLPRNGNELAITRNVLKRDIHLHWPLGGAVNVGDLRFAAVVQRIPRRQYARTFTPNQVEVQVPRGYEVLTQGMRVLRATEDVVLRALFYPAYPADYTEALEWLDSGWASVALSRRITIVRSVGKQLVYDGMQHVGHIIDFTYLPTVNHNHAMKVLKAFKGALQL